MPAKNGRASGARPDTDICDGIGEPLPYCHAPLWPSGVGEVDRSEVGLHFEVTELAMIGVQDALRNGGRLSPDTVWVPTPNDIIAFCALMEALNPPCGDRTLSGTVASGRLAIRAAPPCDVGVKAGRLDLNEIDPQTAVIELVQPSPDPVATDYIDTRDIIADVPTVIINAQGVIC